MKKIILQFKIMSALIMLLGLIHTAATFVLFPVLKKDVPVDYASVYMFIMVGISVFLTGGLQWYVSDKQIDNKAMERILKGSVLFIVLMGLGAIIAMPDNPFAYTIAAIAIYEIALIGFLKHAS
jgi:hypothetical protein